MVVYKNVAVIARPGADARKPEVVDAEKVVESLGYSINRIRPPGTLDGGDVLKVGDTIYVGNGGRTNAEGIAQLRQILSPIGATVVAVPLTKVLHLKSAVTALPDGTVIGYPPLVDDATVFPRFLAVPEESGSHVVLLGGNRLLMSDDCPRRRRCSPTSATSRCSSRSASSSSWKAASPACRCASGADMTLLVDIVDGIATVTLNRPDARNALNPELAAAIPDAVSRCDQDPEVKAIILTGADPAFCAGFDLREIAGRERGSEPGPPPPHRAALPPHRTPVIGAINGAAVTGGFELALACDFLIASERARFADTHARVGVLPGWGLTVMLPEAIGIRRAKQLSLSGAFLDARTALDWGLVNEVVEHDRLLVRAREIAVQIAANPAHAVQAVLALYDEVADLDPAQGWRVENERARRWMVDGFDRGSLAQRREDIIETGRRLDERRLIRARLRGDVRPRRLARRHRLRTARRGARLRRPARSRDRSRRARRRHCSRSSTPNVSSFAPA